MKESYIGVRDGACTSFVGADAVEYFAAEVLASALRFYAKTKMQVNRAYTPTTILRAAKRYTGKDYKRGQYLIAAEDVAKWAAEMKAALPLVAE